MVQYKQKYIQAGILETIGDTPLVQFNRLFPQLSLEVYGKLEAFNPGGSMKDRTAFSIIQRAVQSGRLQKGSTVIESSSGNMAIGLAQICLYYGLKLIIVVDPKVNPQNVNIIRAYGAVVEMVTTADAAGGYLQTRLERVKELVATIPNAFWSNQYGNPDNPRAHYATTQEIITEMGYDVDYLFVATSTGGTLAGCAAYLQQQDMDTKVIAVDAVGSVIFGQKSAKRLLPGHGASRPSEHLFPGAAAEVVHVTDRECIWGCQQLLQKEVFMTGASGGGIVAAVAKIGHRLPPKSRCALLLADRGERYLDTVYNPAWIDEHIGAVHLEDSTL